MSRRYTNEQIDFLRAGYKHMMCRDLTIAFNREFKANKSVSAIKSALSNRGITADRPPGVMAGTPKLVTVAQREWIAKNYRRLRRNELTKQFNARFGTSLKVQQLVSFVKNHGINSGRTGYFLPGTVPFNKGTKGVMKPNRTSFQKGSVPKNIRPLGSERADTKDGHTLIKVAEQNPYNGQATRFRAKSRVVWEKHNGSIPANHIVHYLDGNNTNCDIDNLILLSRAENLYLNRNGYRELPPELKPSMRNLAKLIVAINKATKPPDSRQPV